MHADENLRDDNGHDGRADDGDAYALPRQRNHPCLLDEDRDGHSDGPTCDDAPDDPTATGHDRGYPRCQTDQRTHHADADGGLPDGCLPRRDTADDEERVTPTIVRPGDELEDPCTVFGEITERKLDLDFADITPLFTRFRGFHGNERDRQRGEEHVDVDEIRIGGRAVRGHGFPRLDDEPLARLGRRIEIIEGDPVEHGNARPLHHGRRGRSDQPHDGACETDKDQEGPGPAQCPAATPNIVGTSSNSSTGTWRPHRNLHSPPRHVTWHLSASARWTSVVLS